jgi:uncharacterized protein
MKTTPQLRNLLSVYQTTLTPEEFASFEREVNRLLHHYHDLLATYRPGVERATVTHELIEEQISMSSHIKTSCQKGCGACCHLEVEISEDDADRLAKSILQQGLQIDEERLQEQAGRARLDSRWAQGTVTANRCVLLGDDKACRNYENRPAVCRKHSVVSPASDCETLGANPIPRLIPLNEIIISAAISQEGNQFGSLPKMLAAALARLRDVQKIHTLDFKDRVKTNIAQNKASPDEEKVR